MSNNQNKLLPECVHLATLPNYKRSSHVNSSIALALILLSTKPFQYTMMNMYNNIA